MQTDRKLVCLFLLCTLAAPLFGAEPRLSDKIAKAPANQWVEVQSDDYGGRFASGIAYMPSVNAMIWWGARVHSKKIRSYDTEHFDLATAAWIEAFPPGKEAWKAKPKQWPDWSMSGSGHFYKRDGVGLPRPLMSYSQMAWDAHGKRMIYYVAGLTFAYDPVKRAWAKFETTPVGPPLRLMGSSMVSVPDQKKLVLSGGIFANVKLNQRIREIDGVEDVFIHPNMGDGGLAVGSAFDPPGRSGLCNLAVNLLAAGTARRSKLELATVLEDNAISLGYSCGRESFAFGGRCLSADLSTLFGVLGEEMGEPVFPPEQLELERARVLSDIARSRDSTSERAHFAAREALYGADNPYAPPVFGWEDSVQAISREEIMRFFEEEISAASMVLVVVGDVETGQVSDLVSKHFADRLFRIRAADEAEVLGPGGLVHFEDVGAGDVGRHEIGGELDSLEVEVEDLGDGPDDERLGEAGDADHEAVAACEHGGEDLFED